MINIKLGGNNTWKIIDSNLPEDCVLSIDYKYIDKRYANAEITVTIEALDARRNRQVDRGELYISLAQYDRQRGNTRIQSAHRIFTWFSLGTNSGVSGGLISKPRFHKVVRGKTQYKFTIGPCYLISDIFKRNSSYCRAAEYNIQTRTVTTIYTKLCGCLYHIRIPDFTKYINTNEFGEWNSTECASRVVNAVDNHLDYWKDYDDYASKYIKVTNCLWHQRYRYLHTMFINPIATTSSITIEGTNIQS